MSTYRIQKFYVYCVTFHKMYKAYSTFQYAHTCNMRFYERCQRKADFVRQVSVSIFIIKCNWNSFYVTHNFAVHNTWERTDRQADGRETTSRIYRLRLVFIHLSKERMNRNILLEEIIKKKLYISTLWRIWHSEDRASWYILIIKPTGCINFSNLFLE